MARESKKVIKAVTAEQYNDALSAYATNDAKIQSITAKMDLEITKIRDKYSPELDKLKADNEKSFEVVQTYCEENLGLFDKKRSVDTQYGTIGFRTGTPKLKLARGFKWDKVVEHLKSYLPDYVRKIEEPAKDRLLIDRELPDVKENLPKVGLIVDQDEKFYIDLKKEEVAAI